MLTQAESIHFVGEPRPVSLVELYTSEGCSSCPPAEKWLNTFDQTPELWQSVFPVAFHVDYWDGLGWPDAFARAAYTERQRTYAARLRQDSVYTPEFIVNGQEWRAWFRGQRTDLPQIATRGRLSLSLADDGVTWHTRYEPAAGESGFEIHTALLGFEQISNVTRGENAGSKLLHQFTTLAWQSQGGTTATNRFADPVPPGERRAVVGWVTDRAGTIRQVAGGWWPRAK